MAQIVDLAYWRTLLDQPDFLFTPLIVKVNLQTRKKEFFFYDAHELQKHKQEAGYEVYQGFEATLPPRFFMLDVDCRWKSQQKSVCTNAAVDDRLRKLGLFYAERSVNGGLHVLFRAGENFSILLDRLRLPDSEFIFEFKTKCLVCPSTGYEALITPARATAIPMDVIFDTLSDLFQLYEPGAAVDFPPYISVASAPTGYRGGPVARKREHSSSEEEEEPRRAAPTPKPRLRATITDFLGTAARGSEDHTHATTAGEDDDADDEPKPLPAPAKPAAEKKRKRAPAAKRRQGVSKQPFLAKMNELNRKSFEQAGLADESVQVMEEGEANETPRESLKNQKCLELYEAVLQNCRDKCGQNAAVHSSIVYGIQSPIFQLYNFIEQASKQQRTQIYGEHVRIFLEFILRADEDTLDDQELTEWSVFAPLQAPHLW